MTRIYTIGHSNHRLGDFISYLTRYNINCIVDVRSSPYSKFHPQYNKDELKHQLLNSNISYLHFGKEFGARFSDEAFLSEEGQVDFEKVRNSSQFREGVERLREGIRKDYVISLLCAEAEPLHCHRFSMISFHLAKEKFEIKHILKNGHLKGNDEVETDLVEWYKSYFQPSLFDVSQSSETIEAWISKAYRCKNYEIGFWPNGKPTETKVVK